MLSIYLLLWKGLFGGMFKWRFFSIFGLDQLSFNSKFIESQFIGKAYIANAALGAILGLVSIHQAAGSWMRVFGLLIKFHPLLFLPIFGFVTFDPTPKGKPQNFLFGFVIISSTCLGEAVDPRV